MTAMVVAAGSEKIQVPPIASKSAITPRTLHDKSRQFMIARLGSFFRVPA
ncbi:hypothetical protein [Neorhizobium petrolearium]|uniref:Uncharacterized protein n=1 Tax=Neorhizobium petrolearium TaxID=515361 RepID=A0ABY8M0Q6_9HYPH|nr:hypothetical protein [Neorhizobium petrolearium]MCC2613055.1 hypothetical protein [Neorhizobium petrolearium]WGI68152.1 hypothetical protein QEO92_24865 [Neorhizobium petrolearium]